jgi:hypothetical protein
MTESGLSIDEQVELAQEREDLDELRRLAAAGSSDATDILVELAGSREDLDELRRFADAGNSDAADILMELTEE